MEPSDSMMSFPSGEIAPLNQSSFRKPVLLYLKTNASPRLLLKLMQISRYFCYTEFPYMVVDGFRFLFTDWQYLQLGERRDHYQTFDFDNLIKQLWIKNELIFFDHENHLSHLLSKTAVCDVKYLHIAGQCVKMDEFKFLISSNFVEHFIFQDTQVVYDDGSNVPVEEIVKLLPNLKEFKWFRTNASSPILTPASTAKLIEYLNPSTLISFELRFITEIFDFKLFADFMDKNPLIRFRLKFNIQLSNEYIQILQAYVDRLIKTGEYKNRKILIDFPRENEHFYEILYKNFHPE